MILNSFDLTDKVAIVTGACQGLGQAMALGLAEAGADVVGIDIGDMSETEEKVLAVGRSFLSLKANLMEVSSIDESIKKVVDVYGKVDILINNAGIIRRDNAIDFSEKDWDDVMNINVKSVFFMSQAVAKEFMKQGTRGKIINIASMLSFQGGIRVPSYTASKSGVLGLTRLLANEWADQGINVNAIAPGYMATANTKALREDEARNKEILNRIPAKVWGIPDDLKGPAVFLASDASNYVNGFTVAVDGGWLAR